MYSCYHTDYSHEYRPSGSTRTETFIHRTSNGGRLPNYFFLNRCDYYPPQSREHLIISPCTFSFHVIKSILIVSACSDVSSINAIAVTYMHLCPSWKRQWLWRQSVRPDSRRDFPRGFEPHSVSMQSHSA